MDTPRGGALYFDLSMRGMAKTIQGAVLPRCMSVALSDDQSKAVNAALYPIEVVEASAVSDACKQMATVLPLVVVVDADCAPEERAKLDEVTSACRAVVLTVDGVPNAKWLGSAILDALREAERRRG